MCVGMHAIPVTDDKPMLGTCISCHVQSQCYCTGLRVLPLRAGICGSAQFYPATMSTTTTTTSAEDQECTGFITFAFVTETSRRTNVHLIARSL